MSRLLAPMVNHSTTQAVQQYLDIIHHQEVDASSPLIQDLLARSVGRLRFLCETMLHRSYPRLLRPPFNLESDEVLSGVVERLLKALKTVRPETVREYFGLASRHLRWELDDLVRRLDTQRIVVGLDCDIAAPHESHGSELSSEARNILNAIEELPIELQEVFDLVRIQGLTHIEAAEILQVSSKTVQRRLASCLVRLALTVRSAQN